MEYLIHILIMICIYTILTLSLNLILGFAGIPSFGHAVFFGIGAYVSALTVINLGFSPLAGLVAGAITAAFFGIIIAYPSLRLKGDYLALATFGFAVILYSVAKNWISVTRGPLGIPGIPSFSVMGFQFSEIISFLALAAFFVILTYFTIRRIVNSPFGRILRGIRDDEIAVMAMGKDVNKYKITVFAISAFFAGIAGSLYAHYITFIDPSSFTLMESITIVLMVVFGGMGSLKGSFAGAAILIVFPEVLRFIGMPGSVAAPLRQMIYGLLLVVLMLKRPQGLFGKYKFK